MVYITLKIRKIKVSVVSGIYVLSTRVMYVKRRGGMQSIVVRKRRHVIDLVIEILCVARVSTIKTRIAGMTHINYKRTVKFLGHLQKRGLINEIHNKKGHIMYLTSESGLKAIELYTQISSLLFHE